jgi:Fe-S-cluster containining protein
MEAGRRFPVVTLQMAADENRRCPFVTQDGCTVYEDRPGACRIYPVGRGAVKVEGEATVRERFFLVREAHCLGFQEDREWTLAQWTADQAVDEYNTMNDAWMQIFTVKKELGENREVQSKLKMFYMASYNLDRFREFIFQSRFLTLFDIAPNLTERLASDDVALMRFAFEWLRFSLFGERTLQVKSQAIGRGC